MTQSRETIEYGTVLIGNDGGDHVSIIRANTRIDEWFGATVKVHCDCWWGKMSCSFMDGELRRFAEEIRQLHSALRGTARLYPIEPNISLTLAGDGKGHVTVEGVARNDFHRGTKLEFRFDIDQTYLLPIAESLEKTDPLR